MPRLSKTDRKIKDDLFAEGSMTCSKCKKVKGIDKFLKSHTKRYGIQPYCRVCDVKQRRKRAAAATLKLQKMRKEAGCYRCGYNANPALLHWHHRDPSTKIMEVTNMKMYTWNKVLEEINKCDVLCIRCHAIVEPRGFIKNG